MWAIQGKMWGLNKLSNYAYCDSSILLADKGNSEQEHYWGYLWNENNGR